MKNLIAQLTHIYPEEAAKAEMIVCMHACMHTCEF